MRGSELPAITANTPGAVLNVGTRGMPSFYTIDPVKLRTDNAALDAAEIAKGSPGPEYVFQPTTYHPTYGPGGQSGGGQINQGAWVIPHPDEDFGFFGGLVNIAKTVAPIALTALGANFLLPELMGAAGAGAAGAGAAGAGAAGAGALGADALLASELAAYPTAGIVGSGAAGAGAGLTSLASTAPEILTAGSAPGALAATLPAYVAPAAAVLPEVAGAGATSINQMIAAGTSPGSVGAAGAASGALSGADLAAAQGLVTAGATPALVTAAQEGAQNYIDTGGSQLSAQGGGPNGTDIYTNQSVNQGVASGLSPGSMGADMAARGALTPAELAAAAGVTSTSGLPNLSKVKLPGSDKSSGTSGTGGLSALALAALLASMNKGSGTDDSYKGTIPEYDFSRTQNARPEKYRAGQGNVSYFTPGTYTAKAAGGGIMGLDDGGESSQFNFAEKDNYPSGSGYPSREVDQGGIVQQTNPQFAGLGSLLQSANPPQDYNMAQGGAVPVQYNLGSYSDGGRLLKGPGDGVSDSIPAIIGEKQPARLATGEFVIPARIVSELGNGSTEAGAQRLYEMMKRIQQTRRKTKNVAANTNAAKYLPA